MKFITASNLRYYDLAKKCMDSLLTFGYEFTFYNLENCVEGINAIKETNVKFNTKGYYLSNGIYLSKALFKPQVVKHALQNETDKLIVWIDADAQVLKPFEIKEAFDVGVCERPKWDKSLTVWGDPRGKYNAGVIFFQNTPETVKFVDDWVSLTPELRGDQHALNKLVADKTRRTVVKIFPSIYNDFEPSSETIIFHQKGRKKEL